MAPSGERYPRVLISAEMLAEARRLAPQIQVQRTRASPLDTLTGALGEFAFAQWLHGDWRQHEVGRNRGAADFEGRIEIKTSVFPFSDNLHLLVREDYARKRHPPFYVQIILDADSGAGDIAAGTEAIIAGFASSVAVEAAPLKDMGSKFGGTGGYRCHGIAVRELQPMSAFREALAVVESGVRGRLQPQQVTANSLRFAYLEMGRGPLVLLLHGFPDNAWSWEHQMPALAAAGYRVVAPFLRGYPPSEIPAQGYYDRATLAEDVKCLIEALNGGEPAFLVAQDWGAAISYGVLGAYPQWIKRAVILAVPHPVAVQRMLRRSPKHVLRSFHWFLFQLPRFPEWLLRARNFAFLEFLWRLWSPSYRDQAHVAQIKQMMAQPGALEASLAYYRAMLRPERQDPGLADLRARLDQPTPVPTLVLCGSHDMRREMIERQREFFTGEYEWNLVTGAGHFLHREQPEAVNGLILRWLGSKTTN